MVIAGCAAYRVEHAAYHGLPMRAFAAWVKTMASQRSALLRLSGHAQWVRAFAMLTGPRRSNSADSLLAVGFGREFWI